MTLHQESNRYTIPSGEHILTIRNRKRMDMTSVKSIERFDQEEFFIKTSQGHLLIRGEELHIVHLDVDKGLLTLEGTVKPYSTTRRKVASRKVSFINYLDDCQ